MDRRSLERLRTDRRLTGRKGWLQPQDLEREAQKLPDASDKIAPQEESADAREDTDGARAAGPSTRSASGRA
ncbi:MAG TPA: hypothetical protein VEC18_09990 [Myxococcota bacterium]|nr:hypothetical protein [Myxococcota bacterium]